MQSCRRVARTIFLGSAPSGTLSSGNLYRGIDEKRILLGSALPSAPLAVFRDSLLRLQDKLYYLNVANDKFWFNVRPNLRREMEDRKGRYDLEQTLPFMRDTLRRALRKGMFAAVHIFAPGSDIADDEQLRLVVLPPQDAYSKTVGNNALTAAQAILEKRGDVPRQNRNRLIFLAPEYDAIPRLVELIKSCLAWQSIIKDSTEERLVLDTLQIKNARKNAESALQIAGCAVMEAFRWLLVPYCGKSNLGDILWEKLALPSGTTNLMEEIERQLRDNELVIESWAPVHLHTELKNWFWTNGDTEKKALEVWQAFCNYLYLPRLSSRGVFVQTINAGSGSRDFFGLAQAMKEDSFLGFSFGKACLVTLDASLLLISPEKAINHELREPPEIKGLDKPEPVLPPPGGKDTNGKGPDKTPGEDGSKKTEPLRRFVGSVSIDPMAAKMQTQDIINEVISCLFQHPGSKVQLTLEITAETDAQGGFNDATLRAVRENSRTLHFKFAEFE